ncbi:MAG: pantetheine-phosphate adenylyltransferase [Verrucomicrobiota bacterium]
MNSVKKAIYPGSFDPVTKGHLDVIARACGVFDHVVIAVANNQNKDPLFTIEERIDLVQNAVADTGLADRLEVKPLDGLLVDFAKEEGIHAVIRGLRAISDFEFEFQLALMNRSLAPKIETIFLMPTEEFTYLSSSIVKEVARLGGDVSAFVPPATREALTKRFASPS